MNPEDDLKKYEAPTQQAELNSLGKKEEPPRQGYSPKKAEEKKGCIYYIGIAAIVLFVIGVIGTIGIGVFISRVVSRYDYTAYEETPVSQDYIAVLYFEGVIQEASATSFGETVSYNHNWTLNEIDDLINDKNNKGIIIYINSPGGGVYESDEIYNKLMEYKEETNRPVFAYMAQTAASGGLYISMAADEIYANRMTLTGSIGVVMSLYDMTGLMEKLGIEDLSVTSGRNKAFGGTLPVTGEQKSILQGLINESYEIFVDIVASSREMSSDEVKEFADGRILSAKQAHDLGLIDGVMSWDETLEEILSRDELSSCDIINRVYEDNSFWGILSRELGMEDLDIGVFHSIKEIKEVSGPSLRYEMN